MKKILPISVIGILIFNSLVVSGSSLYAQSAQQSPSLNEYDMVVIAPDIFSDKIQPLINHKNSVGILTFLKTIEDIYGEYPGRDNAEQIKYFIKDAIENYNIQFVLLIGGIDFIPARYTHIYFHDDFGYPTPSEWIFPSDFYYADIYDENKNFSSWDSNNNDVFAEYAWDGNYDLLDFTSDVYLGRLPCNNDEEVRNCVQKIMNYEIINAWAQNWFNTIVYIGGDSLPGDPGKIDEGEYVQQQVINIMQGFIPFRIWASNGDLNSPLDINEAINEGAGFVFFNGHGNYNKWATHPHESRQWIPKGYYTLNDIENLENKEKLPIIISDACYHCQYDDHSNCFAWSFVNHPNGGAIAFIGGSNTDLGFPGTAIVEKGIERLCLEISYHYMNGCLFLGKLVGDAIISYNDGNMNEVDIITILQNHLFGDPSLMISGSSHPPFAPNPPVGVSSGKIKIEYSYSVETEDPDGDDIYYLFDWGDDRTSGWTGPYKSNETCNLSHTWEKQGSYDIKVRAKDEHGVQSEWSDPLVVSMPKNKALNLIFFQFLGRLMGRFPLLKFLLDF